MTGIHVTTTDSQPDDQSAGETEAPDTSPLAVLRRVRDAKRAELHLDLEVPRYRNEDGDPGIAVRFRPMRSSEMIKAVERHQKTEKKNPDWIVDANADVIAKCCLSVMLVASDGTKVNMESGDPETAPTTFNHPGLAEALGVTSERQIDVVKALYLTDGDLMGAANRLSEWSAARTEEVQETLAGE